MKGLIKRDSRFTVTYNAHNVGISSWSAQKIFTQQLKLEVCALCAPIACLKNKNASRMRMPSFLMPNCDKSRISELLTDDGTTETRQ